ncbi:hypothetical protein EVA_17067 [gut metagenome]|uniref:Uncharacterized protein n=1 Tax=gut metagenome TaxID=749906 RepID=J9FIT2_9ZZZZ
MGEGYNGNHCTIQRNDLSGEEILNSQIIPLYFQIFP